MPEAITREAVPVGALPRIRVKVAAAGRKCERWGLLAPVLAPGPTYQIPDPGYLGERKDAPLIDVVDLALTAPERIGIPGWTLLGRIDVLPDGSWLTLRTPGTEDVALPAITDPTACEHCRSRRHRKDTFLVSDPSGAIKQVGRNCLRDHLGYDPERLLMWSSLTRDIWDISDEPSTGERLWPTPYVLRLASRVAAHDGYLGRAKAAELAEEQRSPVPSTRAHVDDIVYAQQDALRGGSKARQHLADLDARYPDDEASGALYEATLAAIPEASGSEWADNVHLICSQASIRPRHLGIAISAVVLGLQRLQPERPEREEITSAPLGTVGERIDLTGEVTFTRQFDSAYGARTLIKIRVGESDVTWWATGSHDVASGDPISLRATIKAHEQDRFTRRLTTVVTRGKEIA